MSSFNETLSKSRVEVFSDGIFAIVITLLVLELRIGEVHHAHSSSEMWQALIEALPKLVSLVISFLTICVIWINHHRIFSQLHKFDLGLFWLNSMLVLWVSLIPFPTALIGEYPSNAAALALYGVVMALMALSFALMRMYASRFRCLHDDIDPRQFRHGTRMAILLGPIPYAIGALASFLYPHLAFAIYLLIPVYFILPRVSRSRVD